jgi:hypothetical protein
VDFPGHRGFSRPPWIFQATVDFPGHRGFSRPPWIFQTTMGFPLHFARHRKMTNSDGSGESNVISTGSHQNFSGQKRGATVYGLRNSRRRREIEKASKQRAKDLNCRILKSKITWGDYNTDFPASSTSEEELHDFLQRIEKVSTFPKIQDDTSARLLSRLRETSSKLDILTQLQSDFRALPQDDVYL